MIRRLLAVTKIPKYLPSLLSWATVGCYCGERPRPACFFLRGSAQPAGQYSGTSLPCRFVSRRLRRGLVITEGRWIQWHVITARADRNCETPSGHAIAHG